jgi:TolB-like protein/Tfp pilus assembly protein PilF/DNA-binding winged helix-turn-helix (wHTH) protein
MPACTHSLDTRGQLALLPKPRLQTKKLGGPPMSEDLFQGFGLGDLKVEPFKGQVTGSYGSRHMSPKAVEVLLRLARQPGEVVSRNVLLDEVWGAGQGTPEALGHAVGALRYALDDHAANPRFIQTLPKRGYRLMVDPAPLRRPVSAASNPPGEAPAQVDFFGELKRRGVVQTGLTYVVVGWLVLQVVDVIFEPLMLPQWFGTFIAVLVIAGFPIALLLAWFIEIVEGRAVLDRRTGASAPTRIFSRPYAAILAALALASIGVYAYDHYIGLPDDQDAIASADAALEVDAPIEPNSIAVLPFLNIDGSEETRIFSEGLAEDVINRLAKVPAFRVSARGDSFSLLPTASSDEVRKRLRVSYYLEGSVRLAEEKMRVVIQLINSANGFQVLSRTFDRSRQEFFEIQDEITSLTVANLRLVLPPETQIILSASDEYPDLDAYVLYRRGMEAYHRPKTTGSIDEALDWFNQSLLIDPDFAAAHAGICTTYASGFAVTSDPAFIDKAEQSCAAALRRNPNLDVVHWALGDLYLHTGRNEEAELAFKRALAVNVNNVSALSGLADVYYRQQKSQLAEETYRRAIGLQPGNWSTYNALGWFLYQNGRYTEAAEQYKTVVSIDATNMQGWSNLGTSLMFSGNFSDAAPAFMRSIKLEPSRYAYTSLGLLYYYLGDVDEAAAALQEAVKMAPNDHRAWANLGDALSFSEQSDSAIAAFRTAEELAENQLSVNPGLAETLIDLAWIKVMVGKTEEGREAIARAQEMTPGDPQVYFIKALISVRSGDVTAAYDNLELALEKGYPPEVMAAEPHLRTIRLDPQFRILTAGSRTKEP